MASLDRDFTVSTFDVPVLAGFEATQVQPGDHILLLPASLGAGGVRHGTRRVRVVEETGTSTTRRLVASEAIPAECADYPRFQVWALGLHPLVLLGPAGNYLGRLGQGDVYTAPEATYFFHPAGYAGQETGPRVRLSVVGTLSDPATRPARDESFVVQTQSRFAPYLIGVDGANVGSLTAFRLQGP